METLKERLQEHYKENYDEQYEEDLNEVFSILDKHDDDLSELKDSWDKTLILSLIDDEELYDEVDSLGKEDYEE